MEAVEAEISTRAPDRLGLEPPDTMRLAPVFAARARRGRAGDGPSRGPSLRHLVWG